MNHIIKFSKVIFLLIIYIIVGAKESQKYEWKGKIDYEKGIKVIINPREPLYGEIKFELVENLIIGRNDDVNHLFYNAAAIESDKYGNIFILDIGDYRIKKFDRHGNYLQTIGRKGQGLGEFEYPTGLHVDSKNDLYVIDGRKIHIFNNKGEFIRNIKLSSIVIQLDVTKDKNILAHIFSYSPEELKEEVSLIDSEEKRQKLIMSFPRPKLNFVKGKKGISVIASHAYSPALHFSPLNGELAVYGYSSEYRLFVINFLGEIIYEIEKDELLQLITQKEKNRVIDDFIESLKEQGQNFSRNEVKKAFHFFKFKPFFHKIITDDKYNIYVYKGTNKNDIEFDLFNKEGFYLYRVKMPYFPLLIKNGHVYLYKHNKDTGYSKIIRYKIKNYNHLIRKYIHIIT